MMGPLAIVTAAFAVLAILLLLVALGAGRRRRRLGSAMCVLAALLFLSLAALAATLSVATLGYRALTREEIAAVVTMEPVAARRIRASFRYADGTRATYELAGDGISVEAHIVKWHPLVNVLGLHTAYELVRVAGRYDRLADEQTRPRTIHPLTGPKPVDMVQLTRSLRFLGPLVDAEYGSATFLSAREPAELELRVSTSGLLLRPVAPPARGR